MNAQEVEFMNDELERKAKLYAKLHADKYGSIISSSNFNHIVNNLLTVLFGIPFRIEIGNPIEEIEKSYLMHKNALYLYFSLIEKFPDFGKSEFSSQNGFFPDIPKAGSSSIVDYVNEASKGLEQRV